MKDVLPSPSNQICAGFNVSKNLDKIVFFRAYLRLKLFPELL